MNCEQCSGSNKDGGGHCCWSIAMEIRAFKKRVFRLYIIETLFDMIVSLASVVIDIVILVHYARHKKWLLAVLTGLPVLLPTIVFTNVYMSDISRGYCKLPKHRRKKPAGNATKNENGRFLSMIEKKTQTSTLGPLNCFACLSGILHSVFHCDGRIRKRGAQLAWKSMRRSIKYFFGTLVLRFIAWTWYLKALIFGLKAHRDPKKFMKIQQPDAHWTRDLLIRLDFFQAALENAPQCIIQLYALLSEPGENVVLGCLALALSFVDFIRVATTVLWNINKGPVEAPEHCYGTLIWQLMNITSWILLYIARCCAVGLIIGTVLSAQGTFLMVPILALLIHCTIFSVLVSRLKAGQASEKMLVTTFISLFFLPDLDSTNVHLMIQFYYAMTLLENIFFIVPWGWDLDFTGFCFARAHVTTPSPPTFNDFEQNFSPPSIPVEVPKAPPRLSGGSNVDSDCMMDPVVIVIIVPSLTILGVVLRLAAAKRMNHFKSSQPPTPIYDEKSFLMEERIASIYNRKWTKMTIKQIWTSIWQMLLKEVPTQPEPEEDNQNMMIEFKMSPNTEFYYGQPNLNQPRKYPFHRQRSFSAGNLKKVAPTWNSQVQVEELAGVIESSAIKTFSVQNQIQIDQLEKKNDGSIDVENLKSRQYKRCSIPKAFFYPSSVEGGNSKFSCSQDLSGIQNLDVRFLKVEVDEKIHVFETVHI